VRPRGGRAGRTGGGLERGWSCSSGPQRIEGCRGKSTRRFRVRRAGQHSRACPSITRP